MKSMGEMLIRREAFSEIVMGNTALVRAMVEAGTRVVTSYPGSPTPEIAEAIGSIRPDQRPFYFEFSTNEKVATEIAYGAGLNGHLSTVFFKSVGLNVAADTFVQLSLMNVIGGMVVVLGDDPGANSSQNEQDNRHIAEMAYTPVFEPASPTEVYRFYKIAARLARDKAMPVVLRLTTHVCHAKERVHFDPYRPEPLDPTPRFDPANGPYIPIASAVFPMKRRALERLQSVATLSDASDWHQIVDCGNPDLGILTAGLPFLSVLDALQDGVSRKPDILKLGLIYPIPRNVVASFLKAHRCVHVIEELDPILETAVRSIAQEEGLSVRIIGKTQLEHWIGEYTPDKVRQILEAQWPELFVKAVQPASPSPTPPEVLPPPARPPQLCPGCGHRSAFYAIGKALRETDITVADIGCHTLGFQPPYRIGQALLCMGASMGIASGLSLFQSERKVVAFLGDSTLFHAGLPGILNALFNRHRVTLIVMENGTTAMTGHQDHAGSGRNFNVPTDAVSIRSLLEGMGVQHIFEADTYQQSVLTDLVRKALDIDAFSVVIARHPCMLKFMREKRRKPDFQPKQVSIDPAVCRKIQECVARFGCPSFLREADGSVRIQTDLCIGDGSCVQTCPAGAIRRPHAPRSSETS
ncbi:MAG: indolepyruvate ferredoxin oxidoreductase subunit alpha [Thermodesulfobacteriota bacterium]